MAERGRPSDYSEELAAYICSEIASGRSLRSICDDEGMPDKSTVFRWLSKHEAFRDQYARAQEDRTSALAEDILDIADQYDTLAEAMNPDLIQRAKLRIDARKWLMSKMAPKRYGDKTEIDHKSSDGSMTPARIELVALTPLDDDNSTH